MRKCIARGDKIYIKSFSGPTIECMADYIKPSQKYNPDLFILQIGSNDLRAKKSAADIADDITNLAKSVKTQINDVVVSSLIVRNDRYDEKRKQVNKFLYDKCVENNFFYIDNSNIFARKHLNGSGIHLNYAGTVQLANNILNCINL